MHLRLSSLALFLLATSAMASAQQTAVLDTAAVMPNDQHLDQIAEAGQLAGEIQACELDWEQYYLAYMQSERRRALNEGRTRESPEYQQRIGFIGIFFGATQRRALAEFEGKPCPDSRMPALAERLHAIMDAAEAREGAARGK